MRRTRWLVIGYGNTLRSDDGAGVRVAEALAARDDPGVRALAVHQLTPELAEALAVADRAAFVDARLVGDGCDDIVVATLEPSPSSHVDGHVSDPRSLLAMARRLYGRAPRAWLLTVPGVAFAVGEGMSDTARRGIGRAVDRLVAMLGDGWAADAGFSDREAGPRL